MCDLPYPFFYQLSTPCHACAIFGGCSASCLSPLPRSVSGRPTLIEWCPPHIALHQNIARNASHYSWLACQGSFGPDIVTGIAKHVGIGVHFNPLVPLGGVDNVWMCDDSVGV